MKYTNHKVGIRGIFLVLCALQTALAAAAAAQSFGTTTVQGTVYTAGGAPASGTLQLSWPAFTTATGQAVAAGRNTVSIGSDGFVSVNLAPNVGASPAGLYYTAVYHLNDGTASTEYWVVPGASQATLAQVRAQVMPAAQAVQAVNKAYVDQSIAQMAQSQITPLGGTLTGPLYLGADPSMPNQAANKHYVDNQVSQTLSINGGSATGPLTAVQLGAAYQADQFAGSDFGSKLQACINALNPTYGGSCDARNFTGTLSMGSNVTIATGNVTIDLPCATIATGNQIVVTAGTRNATLHGCASRGTSAASGNQGGTVFLYSGTAAMIAVGDPTYATDTLGFHLDNVVINTTSATAAAAQAIAIVRAQELHLEGLYLLGNANQTGITLDGTGNYTGGTLQDVELSGFQTAVNAIGHQAANGATTDWVNASTFVRLHIDCPTASGNAIAGTTGINLAQGDGNTFTGGDVEGCATALHLGPNAQNNTIVGLRNENSTYQVVADAGSAYNNWMTGGTMFTGKLTDNGTRNSFFDTFHRSFNALNGDWYGSQQDATLTNHYRLGIGSGNERGLLHRYQTDSGYRWTMGLSDATAGAQYYQVLDELNNVYRLSIGQYNTGQSSSNNQTVINAAGTGAVVLNGSNNAGSGGVVFGSGGSNSATVATVDNAGNAQFNGTLRVGGVTTFTGSSTIKNQADAEIDAFLWAGATAPQKESVVYKDWNGNSQWYMVKDASNNWALNSAVGGVDSFKAYQSNNSGDTYIDAANNTGVVRVNYEPGSGSAFNIYGGGSGNLYASFNGTTGIKFPGLAAGSGHNCVQIDNSGYLSNTGVACSSASVNTGSTGQIAYYTGNGSTLGGTAAVPIGAGGTGATSAASALASLGGLALTGGALSGPLSGSSASFSGQLAATSTVSGSVNGVLDLKAMFGASGSQQTMTCTMAASNSNLTSCSGGDFKVGQTVFIPAAGITSTTSAPAGLTAACAVDNAASCAGSTVYGYEIATIQGYGNGPMTAPTSPVTVTQATQVRQSPSGAGRPDVKTHVSWTAAANAGSYAVYKSVNGGPYNFYSIVTGVTSFDDYGFMSAALFNCTDIGVPCTAPSSAVPNDVYARISAINGSTYTLAALSPAPAYRAGFGLAGTYPSVPQISGTVTVQHDDTPAFTAAWDYLVANPNQGLVTLHIPSGSYNLHNEDQFGIENVFRLAYLKNVTVAGDGTSSKLYESNDRSGLIGNFVLGQCGDGSGGVQCGWRLGTGYGSMSLTAYPLTDPVLMGANTVTLATPSQVSNFTVNGWVTIYNNSGSGYPNDTYGEVNQVTAINSTTGVLTLAYPTNKYYSATLVPPYSTACPLCNGTPSITPFTGGAIVAQNITLKDFWYKGHNNFVNVNSIDGLTLQNLTVQASEWENTGLLRHHYILENKVTEDSYWNGSPGLAVGAAADGDVEVKGNVYTTLHAGNFGQSCTEGTTNMAWTDNTINVSGIADTGQPLVGGIYTNSVPCINNTFTGNRLTVNGTNLLSLLRVSGTTGQISNNNIVVDAVNSSTAGSVVSLMDGGILSNPTAQVFNNTWKVGNGQPGLKVSPSASILPPFESTTLPSQSGIVSLYAYYGSQTVLNIPLSGNVTSVYLGSARIAGYMFALAFTQPAAGGPYTLPADCTNASWATSGGGVDCPSVVPKLNAAASSTTYLWFYDDGAVVHYLWSNLASSVFTGVTAGAGLNGGGSTGSVTVNCNTASSSTLGCVKVDGTSITATSGVLSTSGASSLVPKGSIDLSNQTANVPITAAYAVPSGAAGSYLVSCYEVITTAATSGSPALPLCSVLYTDEDTGVNGKDSSGSSEPRLGSSSTLNAVGATNFSGSLPSNSLVIRVAAGSTISAVSNSYAPGTGTAMAYAFHFRVYYLGP